MVIDFGSFADFRELHFQILINEPENR